MSPQTTGRRTRLAVLVSFLAGVIAVRGETAQPGLAVDATGMGAGVGDGRDALRATLVEALNRQRAAKGLGPVRLVAALSRAAQAHAADMEARGYFGFTSPGGQQIEGWVAAAGYEAQLVTEKIEQTPDTPTRMAAYWGQSAELQTRSLFHPDVDEAGIGIGREGGQPIYAIVLTRSRASYLAEYTRHLFTDQTARLHDLAGLRRELLARINEARTAAGVPPLVGDAALDRAAQDHAQAIFRALRTGQPTPGDEELRRRVTREGFRFRGKIGETVVQGALSAQETLDPLLGRGDRKAQVLQKVYTSLGLGLAFERRDDGFFVLWVQCLANGESHAELVSGGDARSVARAAWLRANHAALHGGDGSDADGAFRDLEPLRRAIGDARIVMLGEATHGDGGAFRAKVRLVRFLHREMGFSVLAFESGLYDCAKAWELAAGVKDAGSPKDGEDAARAAARGVFGIWSASAEVRPLLADLGRFAKTAAPLELAGFDSQFTGSASKDFLVADLERYLRSIGAATVSAPGWPDLARRLQSLIDDGGTPGTAVPDRAARRAFARDLDRLAAEIAAAPAAHGPPAAFWRQVLRSVQAEAEVDWEYPGDARGDHRRDLQMAENLLWLARERYPGRKIVVWAASRHIVASPGSIATASGAISPVYPGGASMGDVAKKALGAEVYTLGFTTAGGWAGKVGETPRELPPPWPGSLEDLWSHAGAEVAFLDFRHLPAGGAWLREPLVARPLGDVEMLGNWATTFDGMVFLRTMTPATRAGAGAPPPPEGGTPKP